MRNKIENEKAIEMLPTGETIHVFRNPGGMLIGADWKRQEIIDLINKHGAESSGEQAKALKHGLAVNDGAWCFIETRD